MKVIVKFAVYKYPEHPKWQQHYRIVFDEAANVHLIQYYDIPTKTWKNNSNCRYGSYNRAINSNEFQKLFDMYE